MTLAEIRLAKGMTQKDLAKRIGITQQSVQAIETGRTKPSVQVANKIRTIFDLSLEQIWEMFYGNDSEGRRSETGHG